MPWLIILTFLTSCLVNGAAVVDGWMCEMFSSLEVCNLILSYSHGENSFRHDERRTIILFIRLVAWKWNFRLMELVPMIVWQWFWHCGSRTPRWVEISNHIFTLDVSCMVHTGCRRSVALEAWVKSRAFYFVIFVVDRVVLGQTFLRGLRFFRVSIVPTRVPYSFINLWQKLHDNS